MILLITETVLIKVFDFNSVMYVYIAGTAFKECDSNGSWFVHPATNQPWSNYSTCIDFEDLEVSFLLDLSFILQICGTLYTQTVFFFNFIFNYRNNKIQLISP